jgi:hypothetical protein
MVNVPFQIFISIALISTDRDPEHGVITPFPAIGQDLVPNLFRTLITVYVR